MHLLRFPLAELCNYASKPLTLALALTLAFTSALSRALALTLTSSPPHLHLRPGSGHRLHSGPRLHFRPLALILTLTLTQTVAGPNPVQGCVRP
jgi:hypothetical protein